MAKKPFSEKKLQAVLAKARAEGKPPRTGAIALFEMMETEDETEQRKQLENPAAKPKAVPSPKRRSLPKVASVPKVASKPKAASDPKSKPKPAG